MEIVFNAIGSIIGWLITAYCWVVFVQAILHVAQANPYSQLMQLIHRITEPAYELVRRFIRTNFNGVDFAPLILIVILQFIDLTLVRVLISM